MNLLRFSILALACLCSQITEVKAQWEQTTRPYGGSVNALATSGANLFAGMGGGVFLSANNGISWNAVNTGLTNNTIYALEANRGYLFAATNDGIFMSSNNGAMWISATTGFGDRYNPNPLSLTVCGSYLYAGGRGIWKRPLSEMTTGVNSIVEHVPDRFSLSQNYPNPFNPSTIFRFALAAKSFVSIKVFDVTGREIAVIVSEELPAGEYSRQWNASALSSGVYFYQLQAGGFSDTKKLMIIR
jgi:hypothetical protein